MKILSSGHPLVKNFFQGYACTIPAKCPVIIANVMTNRLGVTPDVTGVQGRRSPHLKNLDSAR